ncbi:3'-5' exoribonuclease [Pseudomonas fluorescens]|uniref:3'-5' exoribonuclease n=1 Tax=Pseudomonas fluorescens TaxID=294 RepID=UPI001241C1B3|nr:3'-5' exoribonuclease [Pseudomonas fluorescens]VVM47475.1 3'-5' exoribonuclease [Pseudomonas fluorescens]
MKLFLDCEFTLLNKDTKLISLALVAESGQEFYVELLDTYDVTDCSEFVIEHVLPQLNPSLYGQTLVDAQTSLSGFLACFDEMLEICTDAPDWDWDFFCDLAYVDHRWPAHVINRSTNLTALFSEAITDALQDAELPDLPHHALLDARILALLYNSLASARNTP